MFKNIILKLSLLLSVFAFAGCEKMELQRDADFNGSVLDPHIDMTAWQYYQTRTDIFSDFIAAIEYAGLESYYQQNDRQYTFLTLTNTAVKTFVATFPNAKTIAECPVEAVRDMLLYHIVDGYYSGYGELPVEPIYVLTLLKGEKGLMTILVRKNPWMADAGKIVVNNTGSNGTSPMRLAVSCNIMPTNGVVHVFDTYCYYQK